jgi:hypothetical protein
MQAARLSLDLLAAAVNADLYYAAGAAILAELTLCFEMGLHKQIPTGNKIGAALIVLAIFAAGVAVIDGLATGKAGHTKNLVVIVGVAAPLVWITQNFLGRIWGFGRPR